MNPYVNPNQQYREANPIGGLSSPPTPKAPSVYNSIQSNLEALLKVHEIVSVLEDRLAPVLCPTDQIKGHEVPPPNRQDNYRIIEHLDEQNQMILRLRSRLERLVTNIEL